MTFKIKPFCGLFYNLQKVEDLSLVVTPPYDGINSEMQAEFYARSPYNFVKIDLPKETGPLRYQMAKQVYSNWLEKGVLISDQKPALYFHHQTFKAPDGTKVTRKGFFGIRRLEDFSEGSIKPHEKTLEGPKADRLELTRAVQANLSPVFSLYSDSDKKIDAVVKTFKAKKPDVSFETKEGELHELWKITDSTRHHRVDEILADQPLFIADGHHRYETALNYRNECRRANPPGTGEETFNYGLMYFSNLDDEGLMILPIHRALHHVKNFQISKLVAQLKNHFKVTELKNADQTQILERLKQEGQEGKGTHAFALITRDIQTSYLISLDHAQWVNHPMAQCLPSSLVELDVTVLHCLIFEGILGITPEAQSKQENMIYWKESTRAINETWKGECDGTFLLNPTQVQAMKKVALAGEKMPQKSTYFYPKILSGLVCYSLL